jgi:hypothetical protein
LIKTHTLPCDAFASFRCDHRTDDAAIAAHFPDALSGGVYKSFIKYAALGMCACKKKNRCGVTVPTSKPTSLSPTMMPTSSVITKCCVCRNDAHQIVAAEMSSDLALQCTALNAPTCTAGYRLSMFHGNVSCATHADRFMGWEQHLETGFNFSKHHAHNSPVVSSNIRSEAGSILQGLLPPAEAKTSDGQAIDQDAEKIIQVENSLKPQAGYDPERTAAMDADAVGRKMEIQLEHDAVEHAKDISAETAKDTYEVVACILQSQRDGTSPEACQQTFPTSVPTFKPANHEPAELVALGVEGLEKEIQSIAKQKLLRADKPSTAPTSSLTTLRQRPHSPTSKPTSETASLQKSIQQRIQDELLGITEAPTVAPPPSSAPSIAPSSAPFEKPLHSMTSIAALAARLNAEHKLLVHDQVDGDTHEIVHIKRIMHKLAHEELQEISNPAFKLPPVRYAG